MNEITLICLINHAQSRSVGKETAALAAQNPKSGLGSEFGPHASNQQRGTAAKSGNNGIRMDETSPTNARRSMELGCRHSLVRECLRRLQYATT